MTELDRLFAATLVEDEEASWQAVVALQRAGSEEVLQRALDWVRSPIARERARAVDVLGQLGTPRPTAELRQQCANALLELATREKDAPILNSIGIALGHLGDARAVEAMAPFATHPSADVRYGVVLALSVHEAGVDTLIQLSGDPDENVRNWATFALGSQLEQVDRPSLRDALVARLEETDRELRGEALLGLALRKDPRVIEPLRRELASGVITVLAIEAAQRLGDPQFAPLLRAELDAAPATAPQHWRDALAQAVTELEAGQKQRP
ncbi:MAG: HEAT repeat domain-containing protein [Myxococcales bacterium]|nr:HEAT repeat domain-containing protein [Myxococcales bacterium]